MFRRRKKVADVSYDDDGSLVTVCSAYDVTAGDAAAVALVPEGRPVLVRQVFTGVGAADVDALAGMAAEEGWGAVTREEPGRVVVRSTRALTPLSAAQQRARMTGIAHRLAVAYEGWEAALPPEVAAGGAAGGTAGGTPGRGR